MVKIKFLDKEQREAVGFNFIIENIDILTPYGVDEKKSIRPFKKEEKDLLKKELDNVDKMVKSIDKNKDIYLEIESSLNKLKDIRNSIKRCKDEIILDEIELYELKNFVIIIEKVILLYESLHIDIEVITFNSMKTLKALLDPEEQNINTFYIYNAYSKQLKDIRHQKEKIEKEIFQEIDELKIKILKDSRLDIIILEEKEELRIKKFLSNEISKDILVLEKNIKSIGKLDFLIAKGKLAIKYSGIKPEFSQHRKIHFGNVFNPYIKEELEKKEKVFTPISITLNQGVSIITGANMGGKSVTLKTVILNLLLGQMGFFVFAKEAKLSIQDFIYYISDDMQSISKGLSTFGAEIVKLNEVIEYIKKENGFVALDEFARGTNPKEGFFMIKALSRYLKKFDTISLISTHYDDIIDEDMTHYQVIGLKNVDFRSLKNKVLSNKKNSVDIIQDYMDYRLEKVSVNDNVPKDALNIAVLLGLEENIVNTTKDYYEKGEKHGS